jgi:hypothetical protein
MFMPRQGFNPDSWANIVIELFKKARRTVSYRDISAHYGRELDADLERRIVEALPKIQKKVEQAGYACTLVNAFCVRAYGDIAVTDPLIAQKCNVYRSGGKDPVAIRQALPDDLVRGEVNGTAQHLHLGGIKHAVQGDLDDVARGVSNQTTYARHQRHLRKGIAQLNELEATPIQAQLNAGDDELE